MCLSIPGNVWACFFSMMMMTRPEKDCFWTRKQAKKRTIFSSWPVTRRRRLAKTLTLVELRWERLALLRAGRQHLLVAVATRCRARELGSEIAPIIDIFVMRAAISCVFVCTCDDVTWPRVQQATFSILPLLILTRRSSSFCRTSTLDKPK